MNLLDRIKIGLFDRKHEEAQKEILKASRWPEDRELILHALGSLSNGLIRADIVEKLPYPEERDRLVRLAAEDRDDYVRGQALLRLQYPADRDLLISVASDDPASWLVETAVEKLPWPEEKDTLIALAKADNYPAFAIRKLDPSEALPLLEELALNSPDPEGRRAAAEMLEYPASRAVLEQYILSENPPQHLEKAVNKLSYPESRDVLIRVARECRQTSARVCAVRKLPWPEERETIEAVAHAYGDCLVQLKMARGGVCPICGSHVKNFTETVYMNDDPNDVSKECEAYLCETCRWEMIDDRIDRLTDP